MSGPILPDHDPERKARGEAMLRFVAKERRAAELREWAIAALAMVAGYTLTGWAIAAIRWCVTGAP
jgi:fatty acid desaturase